MVTNIIEDDIYKDIMQEHVQNVIDYLIVHNEEFSITAKIQGVKFEPSLPKPILDSFSDFTMFALVNYTFSTIDIQNNTISFEASFGRENFICSVSVPFFAIFQIIVDGSILCLNPTAKVDKFFQDTKATKQEQQQRSKNAFIFNPTNKDKIN